MANAAPLRDTLRIYDGTVYEYQLNFDTAATSTLIRTNTMTDGHIWIVGWFSSENSAFQLTLESDNPATKSKVLELATNQGIAMPVDRSFLWATSKGEDLYAQSDTAFNDLTLYLYEAEKFLLR